MSKLESHYMEGRLHRAFSVLLFNSKDELLSRSGHRQDHLPLGVGQQLLQPPLMVNVTEESVVDAASEDGAGAGHTS